MVDDLAELVRELNEDGTHSRHGRSCSGRIRNIDRGREIGHNSFRKDYFNEPHRYHIGHSDGIFACNIPYFLH